MVNHNNIYKIKSNVGIESDPLQNYADYEVYTYKGFMVAVIIGEDDLSMFTQYEGMYFSWYVRHFSAKDFVDVLEAFIQYVRRGKYGLKENSFDEEIVDGSEDV